MIIDTHVHVGQFFDEYISPPQLSNIMKEVGVEKYFVSSTTMCDEHYLKALNELFELSRIDGKHMLPVLWITPKLLIDDNEHLFINSGLPWTCIKIHPGITENFWQTHIECMDYVINIATNLGIPILIHTGQKNCCESYRFEHIVRRNSQQIFILAHGRPINETIDLMVKYNNVYTDTAFMPTECIVKIVKAGLTDKVFWGSDSCIIRHFNPKIDVIKDYQSKINKLHQSISEEAFFKITFDNAKRIFSII